MVVRKEWSRFWDMATKPLKYWAITVHLWETAEQVTPQRLSAVFDEFFAHWVFQKEKGSNEGQEHYQCRGQLESPLSKQSLLQIFDSRGLKSQVSLQPESNNSIQQGGLTFYVMKDDTRLEGPWHDSAFKPRKRVKYEAKDLECMKTPLPWQAQVMAMLTPDPDDRTIIWIGDPVGNHGKSKLMKWLRFQSDVDCARVPMGSATQIKTSVIEKGPHRVYMVDLPRTVGKEERIQEIYSALEELKNGWVESAMYGKAAELLMEPPHVIIFSNGFPTLSHMSHDRWRVYRIFTANEEPALIRCTNEWIDQFHYELDITSRPLDPYPDPRSPQV